MTRVRFAFLGVLVVVLAGLGRQTERTDGGRAPDGGMALGAASETAGHPAVVALAEFPAGPLDLPADTPWVDDFAGVPEIPVEPVAVTPAPRPAPNAPSGRRRWVNRYPGPIPTPDEWAPPEGPTRIALQAGHWLAREAPDELRGIRENGTRWERTHEWEVNLDIAERAAVLLRELGYEVDVLPAVVPPGYRSHLFISIHADGAADPRASGYRAAAPRLDATGRAGRMAALLEEHYGEETGLRRLPTVTRRMENYYAFNFRRYEHALHPMTIAVILETGFLTSARDREVIVNDPERAARGIVRAVTAFPYTPVPTATAVASADDGG